MEIPQQIFSSDTDFQKAVPFFKEKLYEQTLEKIIKDASGKTAYDYASESNNTNISLMVESAYQSTVSIMLPTRTY